MNQLLALACPSIQYRIRKELLFQSPDLPEMADIQNQITREGSVKEIINGQQPDGWLAQTFHGDNSLESGIRLLCEKGVEPAQPVLLRSLDALAGNINRIERGFGRVGKILDDLDFGGAETIRAFLFALARQEENAFVREQVKRSLAIFNSVIGCESVKEFCEPHEGHFIFRDGKRLPSLYHLRLLALTHHWRTQKNQNMIVESIRQLVRLSPIPQIHVLYKSQLIAPASFCMDDFKPDLLTLTDAEWMLWFHRMELLARLGVVGRIPELRRQVQTLKRILSEGRGMFTKRLNHPYFQKWGAYTGLALEKDWRASQRRINDLTFRSLLILHYAKSVR